MVFACAEGFTLPLYVAFAHAEEYTCSHTLFFEHTRNTDSKLCAIQSSTALILYQGFMASTLSNVWESRPAQEPMSNIQRSAKHQSKKV